MQVQECVGKYTHQNAILAQQLDTPEQEKVSRLFHIQIRIEPFQHLPLIIFLPTSIGGIGNDTVVYSSYTRVICQLIVCEGISLLKMNVFACYIFPSQGGKSLGI